MALELSQNRHKNGLEIHLVLKFAKKWSGSDIHLKKRQKITFKMRPNHVQKCPLFPILYD